MARSIEQPGLVVGFDKPRLNEAQRNGAPSVEMALTMAEALVSENRQCCGNLPTA